MCLNAEADYSAATLPSLFSLPPTILTHKLSFGDE